jgi:putative heme-binding domain-containing protein
VLPAAATWLAAVKAGSLPEDVKDRLATEVLWLQQSFHALDGSLLRELLAAATPDARAAATRVVADARGQIPAAADLLAARATDPHPRVRTEAVRGLSFFPTETAMTAVVAAANVEPADRYVSYTADAALGANLAVWKSAWEKGGLAARGTPAATIIESVLGLEKQAEQLRPHLAVLLAEQTRSDEERNKAMQAIVDTAGGNRDNGKNVFRRVCSNCHKVGSEGASLGPDMTQVGKRLPPFKLVESIMDPNAEVDPKYLSTLVITDEGKSITGLLVSETDNELVIFDGKEQKRIPADSIDERVQLKQSSMPEGLAVTLSPTELLDVIEYLESLK